MNRNRFALLPGLALALAGGAFAQGDDCSTASTLTGTGAFSYDTTGFTTSGFQVGSCGSFNLYNDGFFQWTAPAAGDYVFDTFGTSYDTMMMISLGTGCGATCVGFNDDFGSLQSQVTVLGLTASQQVLIQLGSYNSATSGPGALNVNTYVDPLLGRSGRWLRRQRHLRHRHGTRCGHLHRLAHGCGRLRFLLGDDPHGDGAELDRHPG